MICVFCGRDLTKFRQKPIPVKVIEFRPFIGQAEPGQDNLTGLECCQSCYQKILANRAKAIAEYGQIKEDIDAN